MPQKSLEQMRETIDELFEEDDNAEDIMMRLLSVATALNPVFDEEDLLKLAFLAKEGVIRIASALLAEGIS